jgi:hypothetical protein
MHDALGQLRSLWRILSKTETDPRNNLQPQVCGGFVQEAKN